MSEHLTAEQMERYRNWRLPAGDLFAADDHLAGCEPCRLSYERLTADLFPFVISVSEQAGFPRLVPRRDSGSPRRSSIRLGFAVAATAAAILLCSLIYVALLSLRSNHADDISRQEVRNTPAASPTPPATPSPTGGTVQGPTRNTRVPELITAGSNSAPSPPSKSTQRPKPPKRTVDQEPQLAYTLDESPAVLAELIRPAGVTLKGPAGAADFEVLSPVGTVVLSQRPVFRWQRVPGATSYRVTVMDPESREVVLDTKAARTWLVPPKPLPRGRVLMWGVTATVGGTEVYAPKPPAAEARFKILDASQVARLRGEVGASTASHVDKGVMYAREGLLDDAEREFKTELKANPRSERTLELIRVVRSWRLAGEK